MPQHHPNPSQQQVCYFYLPPLNDKSAEVIVVLNSSTDTIHIPIPEEDIELHAFFQRSLTAAEARRFGEEPTWRIFTSWSDLEADHRKYNVDPATMLMLLLAQDGKPLQEHFAVA
ncbi:hypothetical protein H8S95_07710 [Pontibacter sp. KCTC 32443]|uniref:hypothetical protein n=1 Tax=Pontibacter TaxID=323449 RepID=UPI00164D335A|nr:MULTISPECIES: hypothetical protein [Pontibacter]MBC5773945.1 hypothetical protein [Pontibacter sp. KCTC 32443]